MLGIKGRARERRVGRGRGRRRGRGRGRGRDTEDELFGRSEHVEGEGDFVLVALALEPAEESCGVKHCRARGVRVWVELEVLSATF